MGEKHSEGKESKESFYDNLEEVARGHIQRFLQDLLEQEVTELLGRPRYQRKGDPKEEQGYRNGYGKPRRFTLSLGTVQVRRPRVKNLEERFRSKVLPLFKRLTLLIYTQVREAFLICGVRVPGFYCLLFETGSGNRYARFEPSM